MAAVENDVRIIKADRPPQRFARGWHCLGLADSFRDGKAHAFDAFGTRLAIFADSTGKLHVVDGYCPHMGASLADGEVKGDNLACPFHGWQWGGDGKCKAIPYATRVPPRARVKSWPTMEENKQLFVWHDVEGSLPDPAVKIPRIEELFTGEYSEWIWETVTINTNCRELIDNVADVAHFYYVHGARATYFKNTFEKHVARQEMRGKPRADQQVAGATEFGGSAVTIEELYSVATYYGPAYMIDQLSSTVNGMKVEAYLINCHVPIDHDSFILHVGLAVKKLPFLDDEMNAQIAQMYAKGNRDGFFQDVAVWKTKCRIDNPLLCEVDGPIYQLRRWYEQFYVDVADIAPDMVDKFEVEVDLAKSNQLWDVEEAANAAAQAAE
ncbi:Rieske 2Fe-2S domain-containing protein [Zavarzinia sp.]|uniref:Rieske 2Fe-2S domain-containing protein n=1 Tax=Zavarzinia sp. TaxID=2027920 RepID=UPI0035641885